MKLFNLDKWYFLSIQARVKIINEGLCPEANNEEE